MGSPDAIGTVLAGRFRLERPLGRGASAVVWEATHVLTGRTVAVKLFGESSSSRTRERWLREARAASRVRHPNLLAIDDVLELPDGRAALVMERLVGRSLRERLAAGTLDGGEIVELFAPVVEALTKAHAAGIVHRDLKPDNLFLTDEPRRLVVLDFGVAKLASDGELGLTSTGATVGTPFYMAPEQLFGEEDVDGRADAWALGVVLHECLTGRRPIEAANLGQLLKRIHDGVRLSLDPAVAPGRAALVGLVGGLLTVDRSARASLGDALAALAASDEGTASGGGSEAHCMEAPAGVEHRGVDPRRESRVGRWVLLGLAAVAATVAAMSAGRAGRAGPGGDGAGGGGRGGVVPVGAAGDERPGGAAGASREQEAQAAAGASRGDDTAVGAPSSSGGRAAVGGAAGRGAAVRVAKVAPGREGEAGGASREPPVSTRVSPAGGTPHIVEDAPF